jgi:hypothetical protein
VLICRGNVFNTFVCAFFRLFSDAGAVDVEGVALVVVDDVAAVGWSRL